MENEVTQVAETAVVETAKTTSHTGRKIGISAGTVALGVLAFFGVRRIIRKHNKKKAKEAKAETQE